MSLAFYIIQIFSISLCTLFPFKLTFLLLVDHTGTTARVTRDTTQCTPRCTRPRFSRGRWPDRRARAMSTILTRITMSLVKCSKVLQEVTPPHTHAHSGTPPPPLLLPLLLLPLVPPPPPSSPPPEDSKGQNFTMWCCCCIRRRCSCCGGGGGEWSWWW
jgi:hypothetical protein